MKKLNSFKLFLLLSLCMVVSTFATGIFVKGEPGTKTEEAFASITPTATSPQDELKNITPTIVSAEKPIALEKGGVTLISLSEEELSKLKGFKSDNESIVTVDDGGRIDALKVGSAVVSAEIDGKTVEYSVKVSEAKEKDGEEADRFSTAITANADKVELNSNENFYQNLYKIKVNRQENCVTVYTYDDEGEYTIPVRAMVCSCGVDNGTITGDYDMYFKDEWHALYNDVYGYYVSGIWGDFLFHSVPFYSSEPDDLEVEEFNKLGTAASMGCVRMAVADTKWVYDNCPVGTSITIYDDDEPGPLGKPETIKIADLDNGWDPTDDDENNPYNNKHPEISGAKDVTVKKGSVFSPMNGVTAVDTCGSDITDKIEYTGRVLTDRKGEYRLTYKVTDALHREDTVSITVTVE
ncbi:MAG: DUF5011 domain-containing protein [Ruminococcus sp.]|nr:DUF5011 domain-containing protein [Ruminococcus sp.]